MAESESQGFKFCQQCGERIAFVAPTCPHCGAPDKSHPQHAETLSPKSFGVAVALSGVFGVIGLHHFYLGNILHGIVDLGLFLVAVTLFIAGHAPGLEALGGLAVVVFLIDALHSLIVISKLIIGKQRDGRGRLVAYPGQF